MSVAQVNPEGSSRVDPRIHACQDEVFLCRRKRQMPLSERRRVLLGRGFHVLLDGSHLEKLAPFDQISFLVFETRSAGISDFRRL